jgi:dephospho-CoA kinase
MDLLTVGITGGIGSGKSIVARIFSILNIPVYDADSHAKKLMTTDKILVGEITREFGTLAYQSDGALDRKFLAEVVFNDPAKLSRLNSLVHPRVDLDFEHWVSQQPSNTPYILKEAALLLNSTASKKPNKIIVVTAPVEIRIERIRRRDGRTDEQIKKIIDQQMDQQEMERRADFIIYNDGTQLVMPQVLNIHKILINQAS